jgi:hypothetical protein
MQAIATILLPHDSVPAFVSKFVVRPGCARPHIVVQTFDEAFGIVGDPVDVIAFADRLKEAAIRQAGFYQVSAKG